MVDYAQSELRVTVAHDHDGECSVIATLRTGLFSGSGKAWLNIDEVSEFAVSAKQLSITSSGEATLRGGFIKPDGSPDCTVNLRLIPHGRRGHILIAADLATDPPPARERDRTLVSRMSGALIVEPAALDRFASQLLHIPKGTEIEAIVPGESVG